MTSSGFELDRFVADDERLEITGRWVGVRGRRFIRPNLSAVVDGHETRALADLEHKPWAPTETDRWIAAFPWSGSVAEAENFELSVAPDLAVKLPRPDHASGRRRARQVLLEVVPPENSAPDPTSGGAATDLAAGRDPVLAERDDAFELRDRAVAARENAATVRDQALAQRDDAIATRDEALAQRDEAIVSRDEALAQRDEAIAVRDRALADRKRALVERDRAVSERDRTVAELGRARAELRMLRAEAVRPTAPPDPPLAPPDPPLAPPDPPVAPRNPPPAPLAFARSTTRPRAGHSRWSTRLLTLAAIAGAGAVLVIILLTSGLAPVVSR